MTTTTEAMNAALSAQEEIRTLEAERVQMQQDSAAIALRVAEIQQTAGALKVKFSRGDAGAGATLQKLDGELVDLGHRRDGLRLSLESLEQKMAPLHRTHRELAEAADQERQNREVQALSRDAERLANEIIEHWRKGCGAGYALTQLVTEATARNLDELHRSQVLGACSKAGEMILKASADVVNEHWMVAPYSGFRPLQIVAADPAGRRRVG
ncbi:MAG TPA: hypothetical protein VN948_14995 [Terriglobales bacterium]|nr:hypothetical protein [Terriglobales bacterium]